MVEYMVVVGVVVCHITAIYEQLNATCVCIMQVRVLVYFRLRMVGLSINFST